MNPVSGVLLYIMIWWIVFMMVLPMNFKKQSSGEEGLPDAAKGQDPGAPAQTHLKKKIILTSLVALVVFFCAWGLIEMKVVDFRAIVRGH